jgi:hypothetical protein
MNRESMPSSLLRARSLSSGDPCSAWVPSPSPSPSPEQKSRALRDDAGRPAAGGERRRSIGDVEKGNESINPRSFLLA